jgi:type II secretory pathway pseudopilin PulG
MPHARTPGSPPDEAGFALIEVLISGVIAILAAAAVMTLFGASARSVADQRHRTQAYAVAQEDQARMRAMRIQTLHKYTATRTVTVDGVNYTVESTGKYINDSTGDDLTCSSSGSTVDYVKIGTKVTWPNMRATPATRISSIVAPPSGSLNPGTGTLVFMASNSTPTPISGIGVSGTGAGTFSGSTSAAGCVIFLEQTAGEYTLSLSGVGTGLVDQDGLAPAPKKIKVNPEVTTTIPLLFDKPGSVPLVFQTRNYKGETVSAKTNTFLAYNTGMTTAKLFGTVGGSTFSSKTATPLFPFSSPDVFYAGACTTNNPESGLALASVKVPANGTAASQTIRLPSLLLTVKRSGTAYNGATVAVYDSECKSGGSPIKRTFTSAAADGANGRLTEPGLPHGIYDICVSLPITTSGNTRTYKEEIADFAVTNTSGNLLEVNVTTSDPQAAC